MSGSRLILEERLQINAAPAAFIFYNLIIQSAPKYPASKIFQIVKSITAIKPFEANKEIKEELYGREFWSDGGYTATVGEGVNAEVIGDYIRKQGRKREQLKLFEFIQMPHGLLCGDLLFGIKFGPF